MRKLWLASIVLVACGCGGSTGPTAQTARFAGTWNGTWINVDNATDAGTSLWTVAADGTVDGHDYDSGRQTVFHVVGSINALGNLTSVSTPTNAGPASLDGPFTFSGNNQFSGILAWGVTPVLNYRYVFTRLQADPPAH
jgi:hypothetical protein